MRDSMELKFKVLEIPNWKYKPIVLKEYLEKCSHLSIYHVPPRYLVIKMSKELIFVFSAEDSKMSVTVWAKYVSAFEKSYQTLLENVTDYLVWATIIKVSSLKNKGFGYYFVDSVVFLIF